MFSTIPRRARVAATGLLAAAALTLSACSGPSDPEQKVEANGLGSEFAASVDAAIQTALAQSGSTQAIVGVWNADGEYISGYGDNSLGGDSPIRGAQASQAMMCALLLEMSETGEVSLDREVSKDLTRQVDIEDITYRQLCEMRTGLADFKVGLGDEFVNNPAREWPEQELIAQGLAHSPLSWPGLDVHVSDTNAVLLARALRVRSTDGLDQLLKNHVFSQADMADSEYPDGNAASLPGKAMTPLTYPSQGGVPVCEAGAGKVKKASPTMLAGAGAVTTTVNDLHDFYVHYFDGTFGDSESAKLVTESTSVANPERDAEGNPTTEVPADGLQWAFGLEKIGPLYGNGGGMTGALTAAYHDPATGFTVVVALNNSSAGGAFVKTLAYQIAALAGEGGIGPALPWTAAQEAEILTSLAICQG